jgi:glycosyltransferase involved in cell wall biosynthesis
MIVVTMSSDTMLAGTKFPRNFKSVIVNLDEILPEFDHIALLTQDSKDFTHYFDGITHVPCVYSRSRCLTWILSRIIYARWIYFLSCSFLWMLKHRTKIRLLISINVDSSAPFFSMLFRVPCIVYYHYDTAFQVKYINRRPIIGSFLSVVERFAFRNATVVWVTSPSLIAKAKMLGSKRVELVPNWVDIKEIEAIQALKEKLTGSRILFAGRLHLVKQVDLLLKAFHLIHERDLDAELYIMGDGEERQNLVTLTNDLGLSDNVHFMGYASQRTVFRMMQLSDVFVLPSKMEGNPRVLIEAMLNRLPIVATNVPGIKDMIQHMKTGCLVASQKPEDLAYSIIYMLQNKQNARNMANRAYIFAEQNFSKENVLKKIRDELRLLLS